MEGGECGRTDCITCTQEKRGDKLPPCNKRNVIYENICVLCNPDVGEENKEFKPPNHPPSVYIGETARSLYERGKEHWEGFKTKSENYHIFKHHQIHHDGRGEPEFLLRPIKRHYQDR